MKKVFRNSAECIHIYAQNVQDEGRCSNVNFCGDSLYSYGHYKIARFFPTKNVYLIQSYLYSNTTAKHINHVCYAVKPHKYFQVPILDNPKENVKYFQDKIEGDYQHILTGRKNHEHYQRSLKSNIAELSEFCKVFKIDFPILDKKYFSDDLTKLIDSKNERLKINEEKRKERENNYNNNRENLLTGLKNIMPLILQKVREKWISGGDSTKIGINDIPDIFKEVYKREVSSRYHWHKSSFNTVIPVTLRISGNEVQTSKGANVPIREAKILSSLIQSGKDIHGKSIGYYTVISYKEGILKIGCHEIAQDEVNRFIEVLKEY